MASSGRKEEKPWKMKSEDATSVSQSFVCVSCVAPSGKKGSWTYFKKKTRDASKRRGGGKLQTPIWLQPVDRITSFSFSFYWTLLYILLLLLLYAHQFIDRLSFWQVWDLTVESLRGGGGFHHLWPMTQLPRHRNIFWIRDPDWLLCNHCKSSNPFCVIDVLVPCRSVVAESNIPGALTDNIHLLTEMS